MNRTQKTSAGIPLRATLAAIKSSQNEEAATEERAYRVIIFCLDGLLSQFSFFGRRLVCVSLVLLSIALNTSSGAISAESYSLSSADQAFLEELSRRSFLYFWEQADSNTGLV